MKLNVAQLMKSPVGTTREYDLEETLREVEDQPLTSLMVAFAAGFLLSRVLSR